MATAPKVKVTFDADFDELKRGVKGATDEVEGFGTKVADFGKKAAAAFAVAAAAAATYAVKLGVDGVKAAIADEKSQVQLAKALENTTGATEKQIAAVEDQILKMSLAYGVADEKLRPAFARLQRSTLDTAKSTELLTLAMDVSTATGKGLDATAAAISKAYDGNTAALGKLGVGLSSAELKTMSFTDVQEKLTALFGGSAQANADTYAGRLARVQIAFDEAKETLGYKLLPIVEKFINFVNDNALPILKSFGEGFSLTNGYMSTVFDTIKRVGTPILGGLKSAFDTIGDAIGAQKDNFIAFGKIISEYVAPVIGTVLGTALSVVGKIAGGIINIVGEVAGAISTVVNGAVKGINWIIEQYNKIPILPNIPTIPVSSAPKVSIPTSTGGTSVPTPTIPTITAPDVTTGGGAVTSSSTAAAAVTNTGEALNTVSIAGAQSINPNNPFRSEVYNITVNGALDSESAARQIVDLLNQSSSRGSLGASGLVSAYDRSGAY